MACRIGNVGEPLPTDFKKKKTTEKNVHYTEDELLSIGFVTTAQAHKVLHVNRKMLANTNFREVKVKYGGTHSSYTKVYVRADVEKLITKPYVPRRNTPKAVPAASPVVVPAAAAPTSAMVFYPFARASPIPRAFNFLRVPLSLFVHQRKQRLLALQQRILAQQQLELLASCVEEKETSKMDLLLDAVMEDIEKLK